MTCIAIKDFPPHWKQGDKIGINDRDGKKLVSEGYLKELVLKKEQKRD